ncbi:MAG TPA: VacJ family lipoprotein [Verrucomicrobiae bacterium]|jgi:ABC-type transporter lipoprotein component MlaA/pimeloyl-ACP methyl ester carboxylesterase|nr:VacJ family lipoprotein [Verrucomicrobiae bacterium]
MKARVLFFTGWRSVLNYKLLASILLSLTLARIDAQTGPKVLFAPPGADVPSPEDAIVLPAPIPDPIESVNRRIWAFNKFAMTGVIQPSAKGYRAVVVKPLRIGISNIGRNIGYPRRFVNTLLQARWGDAGNETSRFVCNSVLGIGGIFDMATRWKIPSAEADFGQTLGIWGWNPKMYFMFPLLGPSNERDVVGAGGDAAVNPLTYFFPYSYIPYGITYNNLTDAVDEYVRLAKAEADPYYVLQYTASFVRAQHRPVDFQLKGEQDPASLETLNVAFVSFKNLKFPERGETRAVPIRATGRELPYRYWLKPKQAPIVYILPGVGSHRLDAGAIALAELLYDHGFSVVTVSSVFNYEFIENASTALPGYGPTDAHDLHVALTRIDEDLQRTYPNRLGAHALLGYSMGGFHTLLIAATARTNEESLLQFDRYVAIDAPPRIMHAISVVDKYFRAPLDWPAAERTADIENTFLKVEALSQKRPEVSPISNLRATRKNTNDVAGSAPPFNTIESKFLVGLAFKLTLRDLIYTTQLRTNLGVLKSHLDPWHREAAYHEILQYSFADYLKEFIGPYYKTRGIDLDDTQTLTAGVDLTTRTAALKNNDRIRLISNRNDILLEKTDLEWLEQTFPPERLTLFDRGGHLGNLGHPAIQSAIVAAVQGLK